MTETKAHCGRGYAATPERAETLIAAIAPMEMKVQIYGVSEKLLGESIQ